ncbi:helix-turn-helix transcriptional regulator [Cohnella luojiensis]|uniref:AraC family transcriptional regulator n=1 Tax=Cohnella luojiensis TaxID=652876 RepID=A0A4Y8M2E1_9BACL|nr:AraC family transcriptional regulator [Cohnella luojiensis]TFE29458.1 AraC family transcriptional regulator [Cohnella luojiensis]
MRKQNLWIEKGEQFFANGLSLYVNRVSERFELPEHAHDFIEICYVWAGSGFHYIEDQTIRVTQGDLFFLPVGVSHIFRPSSPNPKEPLIIGNCIFDETIFRFLTLILPLEYGLYRFREISSESDRWLQMRERSGEFGHLFESLLKEFESKRTGYETMMCGLLLQLLIGMERAMNPEIETQGDPAARRMDRIYPYVREHLHEKLSLTDVAQHVGVGERQLQRILAEHAGLSFTALLNKERIDRSCQLLADPSSSFFTIADIAAKVGIYDLKRFYKQFKLATGQTPARYRQEHEVTNDFRREMGNSPSPASL